MREKNGPVAVAAANEANQIETPEKGNNPMFRTIVDEYQANRDNRVWAHRLDLLLTEHSIDDSDLADMLEVSVRDAHRIRTGRRLILVGHLAQLAEGLQMSVVALLAALEDIEVTR